MPTQSITITPQPTVIDSIAVGIYEHTSDWQPSVFDDYHTTTGQWPAMALVYRHWFADGNDTFPLFTFQQWAAKGPNAGGIIPVVTWEAWNFNLGMPQHTYDLDNIIAGNFDTYINQWATDAAAWGATVYLRPMHEMNGDWYPWCINAPGSNNTGAKFITVWRKLHDMFVAQGATNVRWLWTPNRKNPGMTDLFPSFYPGDAYVDMIGLDGYNWGSLSGHFWETFEQVFGPDMDTLFALYSKPFIISETACTEQGGDKAAWIVDAMARIKVRRRIRGFIWFDQNKETDWRWVSSPASLGIFQQYVRDDRRFQSLFPAKP